MSQFQISLKIFGKIKLHFAGTFFGLACRQTEENAVFELKKVCLLIFFQEVNYLRGVPKA